MYKKTGKKPSKGCFRISTGPLPVCPVYLDKEPGFALGVAMASLHWLSQGWGYEITRFDVHSAFHYAIQAAQKLGLEEQVRRDIKRKAAQDTSPGMFMKDVPGEHLK